MPNTSKTNVITSKILKTDDIKWKDLKFLQHDEFKELSNSDKQKLKNSLISNAFVQPFYVWQSSNGDMYCLDGKHRTLLLQELIAEGIEVPEMLPAIFIDCKNKKEASKLILVFSSAYARITHDGFNDFVALYELELPELLEQISIPDLSFEDLMPVPIDLDGNPKDKPATMKITFVNYKQLEEAVPVINELIKTKFQGAFFSVSAGEI